MKYVNWEETRKSGEIVWICGATIKPTQPFAISDIYRYLPSMIEYQKIYHYSTTDGRIPIRR